MFIASLALAAAFTTAPTQSAYTGIEPVRVASCSVTPAAPTIWPGVNDANNSLGSMRDVAPAMRAM